MEQRISKKGRTRDWGIHNRVLDSTMELIGEVGYKKLSIEKIASHSRVTKVTIYKWWKSLPYLVLEVLQKRCHKDDGVPDTGILEKDLLLFANMGLQGMRSKKQEILRSLMAEAQINPTFKVLFYETIMLDAEQSLMQMLQRAQERGEVSKSTNLILVCRICWGFYWYSIMTEQSFVPEELVSFVMKAI